MTLGQFWAQRNLLNGYHLNGNANDFGSDSDNGTLVNSPTSVAGKFGSAYSFDGGVTDQMITVTTTSTNFFASGGTAIGWINPNTDGESAGGRIFDVNTNQAILFTGDKVGSFMKLNFIKGFSTTNGSWETAATPLEISKWSLVGVTYDSSNVANDPIFYLNGNPYSVTEVATPVGSASTGNALILGDNSSASPVRGFDGKMQEIVFFDKIFTPGEMRRYYANAMGKLY